METDPDISCVAALLAEPARVRIITSLLDGRALPATELAFSANISPQTASNHLFKLLESQLVEVETQGRHRYYRLSSPEVAEAIEALARILPRGRKKIVKDSPDQQALWFARHCYNHLAGTLAVEIAEKLLERRILVSHATKSYQVTAQGVSWFSELGIDVDSLGTNRSGLAKKCLDWTERRHHVAGPLGTALFKRFVSLNWIAKRRDSRCMRLTDKGRAELERMLAISIPARL